MRIEKEYKKIGYFWLPGNEEEKIPGVITISEGGRIELEVMGFFHLSESVDIRTTEFTRIIGHVEDDGLITLDDCFYIRRKHSFDGISKSKLVVKTVLSGAEWKKDEVVKFNNLSFSVDCLDEWVGTSGIEISDNWEDKTASVSYKQPENIGFSIGNGMELEICFHYTPPSVSEAKISQRTYFTLKSEELRNISEFTALIFKITKLMCFAMDENVVEKNLTATTSQKRHNFNDGGWHDTPISIYYVSGDYNEVVPSKERYFMLFSFEDIKENAQLIFSKWVNAYDEFSPALGLYFSTKIDAQKYLDGKFLALAQGLETYHRRTSTKKLMDQEKYDTLKSVIIGSCPSEHVKWLEGRLMHGNEISLRNRLADIIEPFKEHLGSTKKERRTLIAEIVDTRNYLTHYDEGSKGKVAKDEELWKLCLKMELIFIFNFMNVIGFTDREIREFVKKKTNPLNIKMGYYK